MEIIISDKIREACPQFAAGILKCTVKNTATHEDFWSEMEIETNRIKSSYTIDQINKRPEIQATRKIYKHFGKDPNRYRPSAEALCRRIVRDIPIYKVNILVDIINLVSIRSGFSIGGFDIEKIQGNIKLEVGSSEDYFEAIGRGVLNVDGLPLYKDNIGGIGTPTSDNERTKISDTTTQLLLIINGFGGTSGLLEAANHATELFSKYAELRTSEFKQIQ